MRSRVLTIGPVYVDLLLGGFSKVPEMGKELFLESYSLSLGGNAIIASALAQLDIPSSILATIGEDLFSRYLVEEFVSKGIDINLLQKIKNQKTNLSLIFNGNKDRSFLSCVQDKATSERIVEEQIKQIDISSLVHIHVCYEQLALSAVQEFLKNARNLGISTSTGLAYEDTRLWNKENASLVRSVDWCFMNLSEAQRITGENVVLLVLLSLQNIVSIPVVTLGSEGAVALSSKDEVLHCPAYSVDVVNTTGSGDSFAAGFIYGIVNDAPLSTCLRYGTILGSLTAASKESVSPLINSHVLSRDKEDVRYG